MAPTPPPVISRIKDQKDADSASGRRVADWGMLDGTVGEASSIQPDFACLPKVQPSRHRYALLGDHRIEDGAKK